MGERGKEIIFSGKRSGMSLSLTNRTIASFGFEWSKFNTFEKEYERNFWDSVYPVTPDSLKGMSVLDAGCGAGRYSAIVYKWCSHVTAFDSSLKVVQEASKHFSQNGNVFLCFSDINHLPFAWWEKFDWTFSIGVLHHLPDPEQGFYNLVETVRPSGIISIWVYGKKDNWLALHIYEPVRKVTTRIPLSILYWLSWFPAVFVHLCNLLSLPLFRHYSSFPFRTKWNDAFDMLSAPSARYYTPEEIRKWYENAGLKNIQVEYRYMNGKAKGIRAFGVK